MCSVRCEGLDVQRKALTASELIYGALQE